MKFYPFITLSLRTVVAFSALAGSAFSLVWLEQRQAAAPLPSQRRWNETSPLVVVDAGHGGHDGGAVANGVIEKNMSLDIAKRVMKELEAAGVRVVMTRSGDRFLSLDERAALAGEHGADAFVSVHLNTEGEGNEAEGIETYFAESRALSARQLVPGGDGRGQRAGGSAEFASRVQRLVCDATGAENRGVKARDYAVVARAACPAVLVECGFITSASEVVRLKEAGYRDKVADGIARGVVLFLQTQSAQAPVVAAVLKADGGSRGR
ncbi:N-acetylmuramoyl-L-alanine amidase [Prosthecobacter sp.]|uniref:N-acetylmuramoyl-L-alanine amidase n=1 Tax=Prosthecobacter sp. TaxID=1965333 RepID=UPI002489818A|nr:N-acetylmuramoyl-L-alanine amidase [Prosthecobacter sp.]MDI1313368.1 N-acetylmuramoyl-L-alanine amidase [Prosthecobacter sp.]